MIQSALDNDQFMCGVFINLHKAFDTVGHKILLSTMNHFGIKGIPYEWFKSYLTNRQQFTTVNNSLNFHVLSFGMSQGSLGPTVSNTY